MFRIETVVLVSIAILAAGTSQTVGQEASIVAVPDSTWAFDVNDGGFVVGQGEGHVPFLWSQSTGAVLLQSIDPLDGYGVANAISDDGRFVVGRSGLTPVRWSSDGEAHALGPHQGEAYAVSSNGSVVVGVAYLEDGRRQAFRWSAGEGVQLLGTFGGSGGISEAKGVSADGAFVVGRTQIDDGTYRAFRWSEDEGMRDLGAPEGVSSIAQSVSRDGRFVCGSAGSPGIYQTRAFQWNESRGFEFLARHYPESFEGWSSYAYDISDNGAVIIGPGHVWTDNERRSLEEMLISDYGVDATGWTSNIAEIYKISANGTRMAGFGRYEGEYRGFVVTLPAPPKIEGVDPPSTAASAERNSLPRTASAISTSSQILKDGDLVSAKIGRPISLAFQALDPGGDSLRFFSVGVPAAATLTPETDTPVDSSFRGTLAWTPTSADLGIVQDVHLYVRDIEGRRASLRFQLRAVPAVAPTIAAIEPVTVECRSGANRIRLRSNVDDLEGDRLTVKWRVDGKIRKTQAVAAGTQVEFEFDYPHGEHAIVAEVSDSFNVARAETTVTVQDTRDPIAVIAPNVKLPVERGELFALRSKLKRPRVDDACDEAPKVTSDAPAKLPVGNTMVTWTVKDASGNVATARQSVVVVNETPVADAGATVRKKTTAVRTRVRLNGRNSSDPDGHGLKYVWKAKGVRFDDPNSPRPVGRFPIGATQVTLTVIDEGGRRSSDAVRVVIRKKRKHRPNAAAARIHASSAYESARFAVTAGDCDPTMCLAWREVSAALALGEYPDAEVATGAENRATYNLVRARQSEYSKKAAALLYSSYLANGSETALVASVEAYRSMLHAQMDLAD